jgi:pyruvate dehydrogenase E2 component (dihydrolipoamide acetyltransferase)
MTVQVTLPELGESVEGGTLVAWLVAVGDTVTEGQAIAEVSTDKVDTEVPSPPRRDGDRLVAELEAEVAVGGCSSSSSHGRCAGGAREHRTAPRPCRACACAGA